jgi:hypothetical protein
MMCSIQRNDMKWIGMMDRCVLSVSQYIYVRIGRIGQMLELIYTSILFIAYNWNVIFKLHTIQAVSIVFSLPNKVL